jgi:hypothetical protein
VTPLGDSRVPKLAHKGSYKILCIVFSGSGLYSTCVRGLLSTALGAVSFLYSRDKIQGQEQGISRGHKQRLSRGEAGGISRALAGVRRGHKQRLSRALAGVRQGA